MLYKQVLLLAKHAFEQEKRTIYQVKRCDKR